MHNSECKCIYILSSPIVTSYYPKELATTNRKQFIQLKPSSNIW